MTDLDNTVLSKAPVAYRHPVPLERIVADSIPDYLRGHNGTNRAVGVPCQISADSDIAAIWSWLAEFNDSPSTYRSYRKEIERFYNWVLINCERPLSSLTREDLMAYEKFLVAPSPSEVWRVKPPPPDKDGKQRKPRTNHSRGSAEWRPFVGPVSGNSKSLAMIIIGALLSYLVEVRYLSGNPQATRRRKNRIVKRKAAVAKMLPLDVLHKVIEILRSEADKWPNDSKGLPKEGYKARCRFERMVFVVRFLANTGLRRQELADAVMSDIYFERDLATGIDCWFIRVIGKGADERHVALNNSARRCLQQYRSFNNVSDQPFANHSPILLPLTVPKELQGLPHLSDGTVYETVKDAMKVAANELEGVDDLASGIASIATPHWFRHTFASIAGQLGVATKSIQAQLGHKSIETTAIYQHPEKTQMYHEFNKLDF